ncbi:MAG: pyridoxal-5-phosphate-dependent protein subunit beta [Candidatus Solibacter sp.]|jgi:cysteine synthase A|nr:pyridoxal-5-phosphate-dependent protein subunit beta [Candidatus Solibacter sp.]
MKSTAPGPTYREMLHPELLPPGIRNRALAAADELDPINLFNITWRAPDRGVRHLVLPKELTGVDANIVVLVGRHFPSGSHKVGPAYSTLMEGELAGEIEPGVHTVIGPSTGNFGIGTAYVSRLKGYDAVVIMPEGMSTERYQRIQRYGGTLDLTPGSESDVILVLERTEHYKKDSRNKILAQFELLPNYRFHRYVTGRSAIEAAQGHGNGKVSAFVSAPGSAGTLAAGDEIKAHFPDAVICALEPKECATLFNNGRGTHRIEGIGDKMVTLIHNVLTTDYVMTIHDDDCVVGLDLLERQVPLLESLLKMAQGSLAHLEGVFGVSGICNILGAIRLAHHLQLGNADNVVTIATDGFDRYPSVLADLHTRRGHTPAAAFEEVFRGGSPQDILDVRPCAEKKRLFRYKSDVWLAFGYSREYLAQMQSQSFWDAQFAAIDEIDRKLEAVRNL